MPDVVTNRGKGSSHQLALDFPTAGQVILLQAGETDAVIVNHNTVDALIAAANTEATFTNYARKTALTWTVTQDDSNNRVDIDLPDQTWTSAGGATNNTLVRLTVAVQTGADDLSLIPLTHHDFTPTTDGSDLTAQFAAAGFIRIT